MIIGKNIDLIIDQKKLLNSVNFEIKQGTITAFIGPSGAGKTTLIKCIAQLYKQYTGQILYNNKCLQSLTSYERALAVGYIFQNLHLFPHMTVLENCSFPLSALHKISLEKANDIAISSLAALKIDSYASTYPCKLSGGQQQRVAICRALCLQPKVLLLDEPTSALDPQTTQHVAVLLKQLCNNGTTIALASHDMNLVDTIADNVYRIEKGHLQA